MPNGEPKDNFSISCPVKLISDLDNHLNKINYNSFNKIDRSEWICNAIRTQLVLEKIQNPNFYKKVSEIGDSVMLQDNTE